MQPYAGPAGLHLTPVEADLIRRALAPINFGPDAEMAQALRERIKRYLLTRQTDERE